MVTFVGKRLQVFVSSTFTDLKVERQVAVEAILAAGHIPAGMELFAADSDSQMTVIQQWIDESDVYVLILGGRYGSIEPKSGKSYTQLEYEYAIEKGKPILTCVADDAAVQKKLKSKLGRDALELNEPGKLKAFRSEVSKSRIVKMWSEPKDIELGITRALAQLARKGDLLGWVRPAVDSGELAYGLKSYHRDSGGMANKAALIREATHEIFWVGATFHHTLPNCRQLIADRVNAGLMFRILVADRNGLEYTATARSFGQTRDELLKETQATLEACRAIRSATSGASGVFEARQLDCTFPMALYFVDPAQSHGMLMLVPHVSNHDASIVPGFVFRRADGGPLADYRSIYGRVWDAASPVDR